MNLWILFGFFPEPNLSWLALTPSAESSGSSVRLPNMGEIPGSLLIVRLTQRALPTEWTNFHAGCHRHYGARKSSIFRGKSS